MIGKHDYLAILAPKRKDPGIDRDSPEPRSFNAIVSRGEPLPLGKLFEQFVFNLEEIHEVRVNDYFHFPIGASSDAPTRYKHAASESGEFIATPKDLRKLEFPGSIKEESPDGGLLRWELLVRGDSIEDDQLELLQEDEEAERNSKTAESEISKYLDDVYHANFRCQDRHAEDLKNAHSNLMKCILQNKDHIKNPAAISYFKNGHELTDALEDMRESMEAANALLDKALLEFKMRMYD